MKIILLSTLLYTNELLEDIIDINIVNLCREELDSDPQKFRYELSNEIKNILKQDIRKSLVNYVINYWKFYEVDNVILNVTSEVIEEYRTQLSLRKKIESGILPSKAKELATDIIRTILNDSRMKDVIDKVVKDATKDLTKDLERRLEKISHIAVNCVHAAAANKINSSIIKLFKEIFEESIKHGKKELEESELIEPKLGISYKTGLGLAAVILRKQITNIITKTLIDRLTTLIIRQAAKKIITRIIPIIGTVLIIFDIKDLVSGEVFFKNVEKTLTSYETRQNFLKVILNYLEEEFSREIDYISNELSKNIYITVKNTIKTMEKYNELVKNNPLLEDALREFLQLGNREKAIKLLELYKTIDELDLSEEFNKYLAQPDKLEIILELFPTMIPVITYKKSFGIVLEWYNILGSVEKFEKMVSYDLYKHIDPYNFPAELINKIMEFNNFEIIKFLIKNTTNEQLKIILKIESTKLEKFFEEHGTFGLSCLIDYVNANPITLNTFIDITLEKSKYIYILCNDDIKGLVSKYPYNLRSIIEIFESKNSIFGKIKVLIGIILGIYPIEVVRFFYPDLISIFVEPIMLLIMLILIILTVKFFFFRKEKREV